MDLVTRSFRAPTPQQWRKEFSRMIETLHREGMTAVKDPDMTPTDMGCVSIVAPRGEIDRARVRALPRRDDARVRTNAALERHPGATRGPPHRSATGLLFLRGQALHGWKRRGPHRLGLQGVE